MKTYEKQPQNNATLVPHLKTPLAIANVTCDCSLA